MWDSNAIYIGDLTPNLGTSCYTFKDFLRSKWDLLNSHPSGIVHGIDDGRCNDTDTGLGTRLGTERTGSFLGLDQRSVDRWDIMDSKNLIVAHARSCDFSLVEQQCFR